MLLHRLLLCRRLSVGLPEAPVQTHKRLLCRVLRIILIPRPHQGPAIHPVPISAGQPLESRGVPSAGLPDQNWQICFRISRLLHVLSVGTGFTGETRVMRFVFTGM